jgi:hypothetical protein
MMPVWTLDVKLGSTCAHAARGTRHRPRAVCACASAGKADDALPPFTYNSSDGRPKATIEQALFLPPLVCMLLAVKLTGRCLTSRAAGPAHRLVRAYRQRAGTSVADRLADKRTQRGLERRPEAAPDQGGAPRRAVPSAWSRRSFPADRGACCQQRVAAEELGCSEEEMEERLSALQALLPDMVGRLPSMKPSLIAELASSPQVRQRAKQGRPNASRCCQATGNSAEPAFERRLRNVCGQAQLHGGCCLLQHARLETSRSLTGGALLTLRRSRAAEAGERAGAAEAHLPGRGRSAAHRAPAVARAAGGSRGRRGRRPGAARHAPGRGRGQVRSALRRQGRAGCCAGSTAQWPCDLHGPC